MVPFQVGDKWLIARRPRDVPNKSIKVHGRCWTGKKWAQQTSFARMFDSQIEAAEYLEQNRHTINAA
jgi:hypothetical protein